jgi:hypothetical protein
MYLETMIAPLPVPCNSRVKEAIGDFVELHKKYQSLRMLPLSISAEIVTGYIPANIDGTCNLDGILGSALLTSLPGPVYYPNHEAVVVPIPIRQLWISQDGKPLWASTPLKPGSDCSIGREYWHKRYPVERAELSQKLNANTSAGRYKEIRTPIITRNCKSVSSLVIGNKVEIERLLSCVTHIGKKGNSGYGRVAIWRVEELTIKPEDAELAILNMRPVPTRCPLSDKLISGKRSFCGWTPPYWFSPWHLECKIG